MYKYTTDKYLVKERVKIQEKDLHLLPESTIDRCLKNKLIKKVKSKKDEK